MFIRDGAYYREKLEEAAAQEGGIYGYELPGYAGRKRWPGCFIIRGKKALQNWRKRWLNPKSNGALRGADREKAGHHGQGGEGGSAAGFA